MTKVHTGHDEATLDRLQKELSPNMIKIKQDYDKVPVRKLEGNVFSKNFFVYNVCKQYNELVSFM